jgi:hypothetical protein
MKNLIARFCLWVLSKIGYSPEFIIPGSVLPFADEITALCTEEAGLVHGSSDVLGDSWLKFRRVATKIKKAHPEIPKRDIFKAIILIHEAMDGV